MVDAWRTITGHFGEGVKSLYLYCTEVLYLSEHAAYNRIAAARAARKFPVILDLLADGSVNMTTVTILAPHLTPEIPDGDPAAIFDRALTLLLRDVEKKKLGAVTKPRTPRPTKPRSRHVPAHIRRAVNQRDGGRCAFVAKEGRRCTERRFLEWHHVKPYAPDGEMSVENISLRCRAHNVYEAAGIFGRFDPSLVREAPANYVAFGNEDRFQNLFRATLESPR